LTIATLSVVGSSTANAQFGVPVWTQPAPVVKTVPTQVFRAPMVGYKRTPQMITRRRPVLGGTSTRVFYNYQRIFF